MRPSSPVSLFPLLLALALLATPLFAGPRDIPTARQQPAAEKESPKENEQDPEDPKTYEDILAKWPEPVRAAALTLSDRDDENWAWTYTTKGKKETRVIRWDPSQPEERRSLLLERNGKAVTEKESLAFGKEEAEARAERRPADAGRRIARTRAWLATLSFEPLPPGKDDPADSVGWRVISTPPADNFDELPLRDRIRNRVLCALDVRAWTAKSGRPGFTRIQFFNTDEIRPGLSVHLSTMRFAIDLGPPDGNPSSPRLPLKLDGEIKGSYLVIGSVDEEFSAEFRDHKAVERPAPKPVPTE